MLSTYVADDSEMKWVVDWTLDKDIRTPLVTSSQTALMQYRRLECVTAKCVALPRHRFGGHPVHAAVRRDGAKRE